MAEIRPHDDISIEAAQTNALKPASAPWWRRFSFVPLVSGMALVLALAIVGASFLQTRNQLAQNERVLTALVHSDDGYELTGAGGAAGRLVPTSEGSYLVVAGLSEAPDNHTYQLWLMNDGTPESAGVFEVSDGLKVLETGSLEGSDAAAITVEPEGGSQQPTSDPVLASSEA